MKNASMKTVRKWGDYYFRYLILQRDQREDPGHERKALKKGTV